MTFDNRVPVKAFAAMFVLAAMSGTAFAGNGSIAETAQNAAAAAVETVDAATAATKEAGGRVAAEVTRAAGKETQNKGTGDTDSAKPRTKPVDTAATAAGPKRSKPDAVEAGRSAIDALIAKHAKANGVPLGLAHAVVRIESRYNPRARGRAGEIGLMQIKPATARGMGYRGSAQGLYDPDTNLAWGMKYLAKARELGGGSICGTVLRYNAGHYAKRMNPTSSRYCAQVKTMIGKSGDEA